MPAAPELIIIAIVILLLFGGAKLPRLARSLGSAKAEFERGQREGSEKGAPGHQATGNDGARTQDDAHT